MSTNPKPLWKHQAEAIGRALGSRDFALLHEAGTGKTRTMIQILRRRFSAKGRVMRTIILCPKVVVKNWKREFAEYSKVNPNDVILLLGTGAQRLKILKANPGAKVFITNYETMQMKDVATELAISNPEILVCDESHRCKNMKSKRAQAVAYLAQLCQHRYIMTGTPVLNTAMDLFMQFKILNLGETLGTNFYAFRAKYFEDANSRWAGKPGYFPKFEPRPETYWELSQKIGAVSSVAKKEECLDLPPFVMKTVEVEMSKAQLKAYKEMRDEYVAYIESKSGEPQAVVAQLAITKALRLQQIVSGFAKTDTGSEVSFEENPRLEALEDLLEDLVPTSKVLVWAVFKENYRQIISVCEKLGVDYAQVHGDIKDKDAEIDRFRNDPKCRVFIGNQGAGGIGINLIESDVSIYFSKGFSLEQNIQSEARNYRGGSERHKSVTRIDLVSPGTIDELVNEALAQKKDIGTKILSWTKFL